MQETYTSEESLCLRRLFPAQRERVFRAWTHPEALKRWWSPSGLTAPEAEIDLRPGGRYRIGMRPVSGGATFYLRGQFVTIDQPKKLVYTWNWESEPAEHETLVTVEFVARGESTEVILTHERFRSAEVAAQHATGWSGCLAGLAAYLATGTDE